MIRIFKDVDTVPSSLLSDKNEAAFLAIITASKYDNQHDSRYKGQDVKDALQAIYHDKCAFCEKKLLDMDKHHEHFRPKKSRANLGKCDAGFAYYWLAISWDNLLQVCGRCNSFKGNCFDILGTRATYSNETLAELHNKSLDYQQLEQALFFNPEQEDPKDFLLFNRKGIMLSANRRMRYTIRICSLNRIELLEKRLTILKDLQDDFNQHFASFTLYSAEGSMDSRLEYYRKTVEKLFAEAANPKSEFMAWKRYLIEQYESFFYLEGNDVYNGVLKLAFEKFGLQFIATDSHT